MTADESAKIIKQLEESYAAEACCLAKNEPQLKCIALNAALVGDFELNAIAAEAIRLREGSFNERMPYESEPLEEDQKKANAY